MRPATLPAMICWPWYLEFIWNVDVSAHLGNALRALTERLAEFGGALGRDFIRPLGLPEGVEYLYEKRGGIVPQTAVSFPCRVS
jgi:hypothetical protein